MTTALKEIRIATRQSKLALWQAEYVASRLRLLYPQLTVMLVPMTTQGDKILHTPLTKIGGKGLFIKELEMAIKDGKADIAVHSVKDVGVQLPEKFVLDTILAREDPSDAFVSNHYEKFTDLPQGARIGTCSLRRRMQLAHVRPDLQLLDLRGNVQTRLKKLDDGEFEGIILASAGLIRLGLKARIRESLSCRLSLPAIGQGAIGIECRDDSPVRELLIPLNDTDTELCVRTERIISERLQGSCQVPLAAFAQLNNRQMHLEARVGTPDGQTMLRFSGYADITHAEELGNEAAASLLAQGAEEILCRLSNG